MAIARPFWFATLPAVVLLGQGLALPPATPPVSVAPARESVVGSPAVPDRAVRPERLEKISRAYLGTPYRLDCLGEARLPDRDPLFTREYVDCQTLVEQVMAEALAPWTGGLEAGVRRIRYRGGEVSLGQRFHYCIPDWLDNPWPVRDVSSEVAGSSARTIRRRIDLPHLLTARGVAAESLPVQTVSSSYLPRAAVARHAGRIPDGSVAVFVLDRPGIVAGHVGFLFRNDGEVILRHASQRKKRVIDQPLAEYLRSAPRSFIGVKVLQPDAAGMEREARGIVAR